MHQYRPEKIYLERSVESSPITRNVLQHLPHTPVERVESMESLLNSSKTWNPTIASAKKNLVLARQKGHFFKPCPGRQVRGGNSNVCCNYHVLNIATNCHMECSYCYLQSYLNLPYIKVYANYGDLLSELQKVLTRHSGAFFRIGTGELADSLALDPLTAYSVPLVQFFAKQKNAVLELKTKSNCVDNLLGLHHGGKTVVSWSINPRFIQEHEEHKTATIEDRLEAAERCVAAGYPVAFHLDPLIFYAAWEQDYRDLIKEIFSRIPEKSISWISTGSLRMSSKLKEIMRSRFPHSFLPFGELIPNPDGKMRYFKPIRIQLYRKVLEWIREESSKTPVYLCMERADVWSKLFGDPAPDERSLGDSLIEVLR